MRTTITLDADTERLLKRAMREKGQTFKTTVNQALRKGLTGDEPAPPFKQRSLHLGHPRVDLTKALSLADELDDNDRA